MNAWFAPGADRAVYSALLDDRESLYYAHKLAAQRPNIGAPNVLGARDFPARVTSLDMPKW
jgi:hypothetical protein